MSCKMKGQLILVIKVLARGLLFDKQANISLLSLSLVSELV